MKKKKESYRSTTIQQSQMKILMLTNSSFRENSIKMVFFSKHDREVRLGSIFISWIWLIFLFIDFRVAGWKLIEKCIIYPFIQIIKWKGSEHAGLALQASTWGSYISMYYTQAPELFFLAYFYFFGMFTFFSKIWNNFFNIFKNIF